MTLNRKQWLLVGFLLAVIVLLGGFLIYFYQRSEQAEDTLEYQYLKSMDDLGLYLENMETTLTKTMYASDADTIQDLTAKLWRESGFAKESLAVLPLTDLNLQNTYQFLSQVGEYANSLSHQSSITEEQLELLGQLRGYSQELLLEVLLAQDALRTENSSFDAIAASIDVGEVEPITEGFLEFEEGFTAYPTLIYDGPFSDHLLQQTPKMTKGAEKISLESAKNIAASATGVAAQALQHQDDEQGTMPSYCFEHQDTVVGVTVHGGYVSYMMHYRPVAEEAVSVEACEKAALEYLKQRGVSSVKSTYYEKAGGLVTFNFAYQQEDVLCYSDLIKVSVALDNAEVVRYDARGYLINHEEREDSKPTYNKSRAEASVSDLLTVESAQLALVPSDGLKETLCYEFSCTSETDEHILVYINAKTGEEEQLLVLYIDENGTLTL